MHRLPTRSRVLRFRAASLAWVALNVLIVAGVVMVVKGIFYDARSDIFTGLWLLGGGLLLLPVQLIISSRARCPLCQAAPLRHMGCQKSRKAKALFGSHRLRVATSVLFRNAFNCPYCGEPTKLMVRERTLGGIDSAASGTEGPGLR